MKTYPQSIRDTILKSLTDIDCKLVVSIIYDPINPEDALRMAKNDIVNVNSNLIEKQKTASKSGYSVDLINPELKSAAEEANNLRSDLTEKSQKLFYQTLVIVHFADTKEKLDSDTKTIQGIGRGYLVDIRPLTYLQENGLNTCLPLCSSKLEIRRSLITESAAVFMPLDNQELYDPVGGIFYGINEGSKNLVMANRTHLKNGNGIIIGSPGSGKSMAAKSEMIQVNLLRNMALSYREEGGQAYYSPTKDRVTLPPEKSFFDAYSYAGTFLHECGHATGHASRLNRDMSGSFGSESYAREELRAEIASAFTAQAIGLHLTDEQLQPHMELHKAYIQSWASALQDAPGELFRAIKDAEKISDYLIEKGEFEMILEAEQEKKTEALEKPVGRIEYLGTNGRVGEAVEYTNSEQFKKDIESETYYGAPLTVVLYQDSDGRTIPKDFLYKLDPPPKGVRVEDAPQKMAKAERPKESFDKLFAGIEKERSSRQAVPPARTIMPQRER